jgi:hypothetical protein
VRIPREALERRIRLANVVNRPLPVRGDLALLAAFVREIVRIGPSSLSLAAAALVRERMLDLTHFTLAFKNRFGLTPGEYRSAFVSGGTLKSHTAK